jgi:DNA-binding MarR family transcriptional regulator
MDQIDRIIAQWARERPELDTGPMAVMGRLARLTLHWQREVERTLGQHGLTAASFDVLAALRRAGAPYQLSPGDLLATMMITSGTMTHRLDQLEKAGMIRRGKNPDDGRGVLISLTETGFATVEAAVGDHVAQQHRLMAALPVADRQVLETNLARLLADQEPPKA